MTLLPINRRLLLGMEIKRKGKRSLCLLVSQDDEYGRRKRERDEVFKRLVSAPGMTVTDDLSMATPTTKG
ncbi:uncharacterized protein N7479_001183 [Penicillium vulpinum]|uniref:uncharacterized protein n=1 Tax=Penicillium vulpinum TaxID=29845 RepID=UPI0025465A6E|nr:uncharacterized protein N7479_001183 [Penicillium vulpinum]KAJ5971265.1 hypothetical protein N7479_001183 [Penicillium vulpinum]